MAKRDDKHSMAKDYLARIKWDGEHPYMGDGSKPDVPNWKYKPTRPKSAPMSVASRVLGITTLIIIVGGLLYLAIFKQESGAFSLLGLLALAGWIIFIINFAGK
jgi:hypothetical protein